MAQKRGLTSSSIVCFKYKTGVIIATDTSASYGSLAVPNVLRVFKFTDSCITAFSGDISDIQFLHRKVLSQIMDDPLPISPKGVHRIIQQIIYERRNRLELLCVSAVVCGINNGHGEDDRFVGVVNSKGNFWFDDVVATDMASHLILPILRERDTSGMAREEAILSMEESMTILHYKSCTTSNVIQIGICEKSGLEIKAPYALKTDWSLAVQEGEILLQ